jgi:methylmalonyl-CoA mutase
MIAAARHDTLEHCPLTAPALELKDKFSVAKFITALEQQKATPPKGKNHAKILGITGTGGAGKSSLIDELLLKFKHYLPKLKIALISIDPTRQKTQGALLGDRIRLTVELSDDLYIRSMATKDSHHELSPSLGATLQYLSATDADLILVETSGIGQSCHEITKLAHKSLYVMTPEYGAQTQLEKIEMLDVADFIAINKFEKARALDALRDVRKQYKRNRQLFHTPDEELRIYGTMASHFNDAGVQKLFFALVESLALTTKAFINPLESSSTIQIIPQSRAQYLREIVQTVVDYNKATEKTAQALSEYEAWILLKHKLPTSADYAELEKTITSAVPSEALQAVDEFKEKVAAYKEGKYNYTVRGKSLSVQTHYSSLSLEHLPKVATPKFSSAADMYRFTRTSNLPGFYPFAAGTFPFKRADEDPKRQFAGEGGPSRTNNRFHFLCRGDESKRLSTAFDSVTLYGEDPDYRPDIFGKIGESGVSVATLQDMEDLYKGFDLCGTKTSVSMTINGPAPIILALFFNAAINQKLSGAQKHDPAKRLEIMRQVRGTVQADILKEDQAQNTCIFSLDFALKMMGDVQEYFCKNNIKNYYSVSISGYHIAEAGANPITQLALTLSNGFTYVEYYLSRGMHIDDFAENLSFFFSNGLDPEYSVIGRVARKIWANAMKEKYGANEKSQKLKYHIQTSGRSLHAQEMAFNDIRTTLQAFLALSDNCNSLHTNAYDEAITTPTAESVRRAMAIQMIINKEFGLNKTDNPMQGSYLVEELCTLVEEAVLKEFEKISDRGGVLGAMESMYQRGKIQEESLYYEQLKDSGAFPIIGVNTFLEENTQTEMIIQTELSRASSEEKTAQILRLEQFKKDHLAFKAEKLARLKSVALSGGNIFEELLETVQCLSLGEITQVLYQAGGKYRRNM